MPDKYDAAIEYLTEHPDEILPAWNTPYEHRAGCLFVYTAPGCGCLTQIRYGKPAPTPELAREIGSDKRIPHLGRDITLLHLPVFAEWNRRLDREIPERWVANGYENERVLNRIAKWAPKHSSERN